MAALEESRSRVRSQLCRSPHGLSIYRSPAQVSERLDELIAEIRTRFHRPAMEGEQKARESPDVLVVAHGHILRALAMRWIGKRLEDGPSILLEAGGVGTFR